MTSYHIIVSIKFCLDVGNDECIILCNFGGRIMSGFEILEGDPQSPSSPPPHPLLLMAKTNALHLWDSVERNN